MKKEIEEKLELVEREAKSYLSNYHASLGAIQILKELLKDIENKEIKLKDNGK